MQMRFLSVLAAILATSLLAPAPASAAPGELIKTDGNPAVYFHAADGKRYVFPNVATYFTWYPDFSAVRTIPSSELAALPIGGNLTYRPGTRLVKIVSDPRTYAVEPGGILRWIESESVARTLYGDAWAAQVDDVPDAFFFSYAVGPSLSVALYPEGSVVRRGSDGTYFLIEDGLKRRLPSADVRSALRIRDEFVPTAAGTLSEYADGPDMSSSDVSVASPVRAVAVSIPSIPSFTLQAPTMPRLAIGAESTLFELRFATPKAVTVSSLAIRIDANNDSGDVEAHTDEDAGGLIYHGGALANLQNLRLVDPSGAEPFGRTQLSRDATRRTNFDQSQTIVFAGNWQVPAGTERVLYLRADLNSLFPSGEGISTRLVVAGTVVTDRITGASIAFVPQSDLSGPSLSAQPDVLEVTATAVSGDRTFIRGAKGIGVSAFRLKATPLSANVVNRIAFQGYIDEESMNGFHRAADTDIGGETRVKDILPRVSLHDDAGALIAGPVDVAYDGTAVFSGLAIGIPADGSKTLVIRGDVGRDIDTGTQPDRVAFDIEDSAGDITAVNERGTRIKAQGVLPNGGTSAGHYATIKKGGSVTWTWSGYTGKVIAGREVRLGSLSASATDDSFVLKTAAFVQPGIPARSLGSLRLEYTDAAGTTASIAKPFTDRNVTFSGLAVPLPKDKRTQVNLYGQILPRTAGAVYEEDIIVRFTGTDGPLEFVAETDGRTYGESSLGSTEFTLGSNSVSALEVRFSDLAVSQVPISTPAYRDVSVPLFGFAIQASPESGVRVKSLAFRLSSSDAGKAGPNNDALEKWADMNGDFEDDDGIANLKLLPTSGTAVVIGEDSLANITYSILRGGTKIAAPSTVETQSSDKALLEYIFSEGNELTIGPGGRANLVLELDTHFFDSESDTNLSIELLGGSDFPWTDIPTGAYAVRSDASGVPISSGVQVRH